MPTTESRRVATEYPRPNTHKAGFSAAFPPSRPDQEPILFALPLPAPSLRRFFQFKGVGLGPTIHRQELNFIQSPFEQGAPWLAADRPRHIWQTHPRLNRNPGLDGATARLGSELRAALGRSWEVRLRRAGFPGRAALIGVFLSFSRVLCATPFGRFVGIPCPASCWTPSPPTPPSPILPYNTIWHTTAPRSPLPAPCHSAHRTYNPYKHARRFSGPPLFLRGGVGLGMGGGREKSAHILSNSHPGDLYTYHLRQELSPSSRLLDG